MSILPARYVARHRRPASRGVLLAGTGVAAAAVTGLSASPASADAWSDLRGCESGGNYSTNTGNGYYGAYQFSLGTWRSLGYGGLPSEASPATQDAAARALQARSGWGQWPACSRKFGLSGGGGAAAPARSAAPRAASRSAARPAAGTRPVARKVAVQVAPGVPAPSFGGVNLTEGLAGEVRPDVAAWQQRMAERGWEIAVDGRFGARSASVAEAFQREKGLEADGIVGPLTWAASWTAAVTG